MPPLPPPPTHKQSAPYPPPTHRTRAPSPAGLTPFWPQALLALTGYGEEDGGELATTAAALGDILSDVSTRGLLM